MCEAYGYELDPETEKSLQTIVKRITKVYSDAYSREMLNCRKAGIITGLPDAYGRGYHR